MTDTKLNQVLAIEKGVKNRTLAAITKLYHDVQKPVRLAGLNRTYEPLDEQGMRYPPERSKVAVRAEDVLKRAQKALTELFDVTAQKDWANCEARANVVVDTEELLTNVPVTYLLFLEKQLNDIKNLVGKIPVLDDAEDWSYDDTAGVFKTAPVQSTRTQKVQKPIVLYDATEEHPAQTQMITVDEIVGNWTTTKQSGALPRDRKDQLVDRVERLTEAVKFARETANNSVAPKQSAGDKILGYLFKS
jgi:hypothetical protein